MADFMNPSADLQAGREAGWNDRQREIDDLLDQVAALEERLAAEEAAKIPRPPKAEWFGTGPNQWDSWWVQTTKECNIHRTMLVLHNAFIDDTESIATSEGWHVPLATIEGCIPVARTGYPSSVGWQVVGEGNTP